MKTLLVNSIQTPDGTILVSKSRHDYKTYLDENGEDYMVDGGLCYLRRNLNSDAPFIELSLYADDSHEELREKYTWGTYGKDGKQPFTRKKLKDLSDNHIKNILYTQTYLPRQIKQLFFNETEYRENQKEY